MKHVVTLTAVAIFLALVSRSPMCPAEDLTLEEAIQTWSFLEGDWEATTPQGDVLESKCRLSPSKNVYITEAPSGVYVCGWDPQSKKLEVHSFLASGERGVSHYEKQSDKIISGTATMVAENGTITKYDGTFTLRNPDAYDFTVGDLTWSIKRKPHGDARAQQPPSAYEHLKDYEPLIGTWRYEGPLLEDLADVAKKGTKLTITTSWKRILNRSVVENDWSFELDGNVILSGKGMAGWDAAQSSIVHGGMNSAGEYALSTVTFDTTEKTSTLKGKGVDAQGRNTAFTNVISYKDEDVLVFQATQREGGSELGPSPKYTLKRVK